MKPEYANTFGLRKVADPQGQIPQGRHAESRQSPRHDAQGQHSHGQHAEGEQAHPHDADGHHADGAVADGDDALGRVIHGQFPVPDEAEPDRHQGQAEDPGLAVVAVDPALHIIGQLVHLFLQPVCLLGRDFPASAAWIVRLLHPVLHQIVHGHAEQL